MVKKLDWRDCEQIGPKMWRQPQTQLGKLCRNAELSGLGCGEIAAWDPP